MSYNFKTIENKSKVKKNKTNYSLIIMIFLIFIAIISILFIFINGEKKVKNKEKVKVKYVEKMDKNKKYIYTVKEEKNETEEDTVNKIPTINIKKEEIKKANERIMKVYEKLKEKDSYYYTYEYNQSDNILSLLVQYTYSPAEGTYPITFYNTYNIDLTTGKVISPNELLRRYEITPNELKDFIKSKFQSYYSDLVKKKYYTKEECNYGCFLQNRGITTDYLKGVSLYVDNKKLTMFKFFYKESDYEEEKYFDNISYQITIK